MGYRYAVDMDLSKFFDRVGHDVLMSRVARKVRDKTVLQLIGRYLRAGVMVDGHFQATTEGTPQGGPASPLLANILLDDLDNVSQKSIHRFRHRIREITGRSRGISMDHRLQELARYVRGWMGYFALASQLKLFASLEQ
ncbi:MAG: reverse transcriptase domain-containing protein [Pirellula sp.]